MRNIDGWLTKVRVRVVPNMHALTPSGANAGEDDAEGEAEAAAKLPKPEQTLLTVLSETAAAEMIEEHVDYFETNSGRSVHLGGPFVKHFHERDDNALPVAAAIMTLPAGIEDGTLLSGEGLDRERGIVFRIPPELLAMLPKREDCDAAAVAEAFRYLSDEWLVDVTANFHGKCTIIAAALSLT